LKEIKVYYSELNSDFSEEKFSHLVSKLPLFLQNKINRLRRKTSQLNSLVGLELLKYALKENGFSHNKIKDIEYNTDGKPFIPDTFHFNLSHSNNIIVLACFKNEIGIDIEQIREVDSSKLSAFLSEKEINEISQSDNPNMLFADIWTKKEAFVKAIGKGIAKTPFSQILISENSISYLDKKYSCTKINIQDKMSSHICVEQNNTPFTIKQVSVLYRFYT
jgi:4'-phosphopantetheinyl transferase